MECKNCTYQLKTEDKYCRQCGAQVINYHLSLKQLWSEFQLIFLNFDNTLINTFWCLLLQPQKVIGSYIGGTRKKYLNVVSFFVIALTLAGFQLFIQRKFYPQSMEVRNMFGSDFSEMPSLDWMYKYYSLIQLISLPLYAFVAKLSFFKYKKFNYTEHLVIMTYLTAEYTILSSIFMLIAVNFGGNMYELSNYYNLFFFLYTCYAYKKLYPLSWIDLFTATVLFITIVIFLMIFLTIVGVGYAFITN
ncbi:DUF3667 domain-containing protein [Mesonia sp. MT50]|uniref:DUF3667 domain-containing protein n=1 Tax=Mesonia profundi TaxID=3070998 RepID=A0ABU1A269_9FLAO|nr:DUF3667 domain-containing protein [Mesonia profundi]MDQ7917725.1 DUF3667 domain-containing protein [Mesonia profundi]